MEHGSGDYSRGYYQTFLDQAGSNEFLPCQGYGRSADINKLRLISIAVRREQMMTWQGGTECSNSFSRLARGLLEPEEMMKMRVCGRKASVQAP